jgi:hypothetical protein
MAVGNWKTHILVDCAACNKPMSHHVETTAAVCNNCKAIAFKRDQEDKIEWCTYCKGGTDDNVTHCPICG